MYSITVALQYYGRALQGGGATVCRYGESLLYWVLFGKAYFQSTCV
jgi:hypothetical protein